MTADRAETTTGRTLASPSTGGWVNGADIRGESEESEGGGLIVWEWAQGATTSAGAVTRTPEMVVRGLGSRMCTLPTHLCAIGLLIWWIIGAVLTVCPDGGPSRDYCLS